MYILISETKIDYDRYYRFTLLFNTLTINKIARNLKNKLQFLHFNFYVCFHLLSKFVPTPIPFQHRMCAKEIFNLLDIIKYTEYPFYLNKTCLL